MKRFFCRYKLLIKAITWLLAGWTLTHAQDIFVKSIVGVVTGSHKGAPQVKALSVGSVIKQGDCISTKAESGIRIAWDQGWAQVSENTIVVLQHRHPDTLIFSLVNGTAHIKSRGLCVVIYDSTASVYMRFVNGEMVCRSKSEALEILPLENKVYAGFLSSVGERVFLVGEVATKSKGSPTFVVSTPTGEAW